MVILVSTELSGAAAHQIRVHLQYLGYPVANDPIYSEVKIWASVLILRTSSVVAYRRVAG